MASVPQRDSKPEVCLRKELFRLGYRYRLHVKSLPGTPDIVLPRFRVLIFVHGCFWHRHARCRLATEPGTRRNFWTAKFVANVERDNRKRKELRKLGWKSLVIWQCEIQRSSNHAANKVARALAERLVLGRRRMPAH
jgi:DNA mismatch endonuclease, patch repair protein